MRISISGTHSAGKTTLFDILKIQEELKDFEFLPEAARLLVAQGHLVGENAPPSTQTLILEQHYKDLLSHTNFISDRCALDAFVYASLSYLEGKHGYSQAEHRLHKQFFEMSIKHYSLIFCAMPEAGLIDDGVRGSNIQYQMKVHEMFFRLADLYHIRLIPLIGSIEERIQTIKAHIGILHSQNNLNITRNFSNQHS